MEVKVNTKKIISLRTTRAWSQQQLAEIASVSLRTIQRIEKCGNASQESVKSISSAFSVKPDNILTQEKQKFSAAKRVKKIHLGNSGNLGELGTTKRRRGRFTLSILLHNRRAPLLRSKPSKVSRP